MKTFKPFFIAFLFLLSTQIIHAQTKASTFKVAGECGMCKKKIETAAKEAGATYALWDVNTKSLKVKFASNTSNEAKIQQSIATVGYDTPKFKATDEAYEKLHECCKYERVAQKADCCNGTTCTKDDSKKCCADGKCTAGTDCCKETAHSGTSKACCTKS